MHHAVSRLAGRGDVRLLTLVATVELFLLALYLAVVPERTTTFRYVLYPFVWINAGLWAVLTVEVPDASREWTVASALIAGVYLLALLYFAGMIGLSPQESTLSGISGFSLEPGSPGWETVHYVDSSFYVTFVTHRVLGFVCLSYLVYVSALEASGRLGAGALGLFSCVGCAFPVFASLSAGLFGSTVAAGVLGVSFDLSTLVFVAAVGLLYWRPGLQSEADTAGK